MDPRINVLKVFIASPSDLAEERKALRSVVEKINKIYSRETDLRIELLGWEDTLPGQGRPQELINQDLDKSDLFIGGLWQRIGTDAGESGQTGFEEEFNRAIERRKNSGKPEIWLFFKKLDDLRLADPGAQLSRVLEFRRREEEAKRLLFREFSTLDEWREQISDALHIQMLKTNNLCFSEEAESSRPADRQTGQGAQQESKKNKNDIADEALVGLFSSIQSDLTISKHPMIGYLDDPPHLRSERLLLFAAANYDYNVQTTEIGTHVANRLYLHRNSFELTGSERLLLLKCTIIDREDVVPGWFWISHLRISPTDLFDYCCNINGDPLLRARAIELATEIKFRLNKGRTPAKRPIERSLRDSDDSVKLAALGHLAVFGIKRDLPKVEQLLSASSSIVREKAERTMRTLRLRFAPDQEARRSFKRLDPYDKDLALELEKSVSEISESTLVLGLDHPSITAVEVVARELLKRGRLDSQTKIAPLENKDSKVVMSVVHQARSKLGLDVDIRTVEKQLRSLSWLSENSNERKEADEALVEILIEKDTDTLWDMVSGLDSCSRFALLAIARKEPFASVDRIRRATADGFRDYAQVAHSNRQENRVFSLINSPGSIDRQAEHLTRTGLRILASNPKPEDRQIFLDNLSTEINAIGGSVSSCIGLRKVGTAADLKVLKNTWTKDAYGLVAPVAAWAYLKLAGNLHAAIVEILEVPNSSNAWIVVNELTSRSEVDFWDTIEPLLHNEIADVRRIACFYAIESLPKEKLVELLKSYPTSKSSYYYNVIKILDRIAFGAEPMSSGYRQIEKSWFQSKRVDWREHADF